MFIRMRTASCLSRYFILLALVVLGLYGTLKFFDLEIWDNDPSTSQKLFQLTNLIRNSNQHSQIAGENVPACKLPDLPISNPEILKFIHGVPPIVCSPKDWVVVNGSVARIDEKIQRQYGTITCAFAEILRIDDYNYKLSDTVESTSHYTLKFSDYVDVSCETSNGKQWHSILAGVQDDSKDPREKTTWNDVPPETLKLNVLILGFDSLSRNTFIRLLPKSYTLLRDQLHSLVLEGYNVVGDGTPQALIPFLTGKIELELPETRKRMGSKANFVDVYPMIWKDYKKHGYVTSFMEDVQHIGTFTYRLKGFKEQPTDHYMRTYYVAASPFFKYSKKFCMGGIPRHMVMLNHIKAVFDRDKHRPKFAFGFHGELSHDSYNDIGAADADLYRWLMDLQKSGHLNNTIFILMSDHGHRFAEIRNTLQGKQEERLPFVSFTFPPWFKQIYPLAYANFIYNTQRLTTPFDVHATLKHILDFSAMKAGDLRNRGISLFDKIPIERTCADAFIEPHWCACLVWNELSVDQKVVIDVTNYFVEFLNAYTEEHRDICEVLYLDEILWAAKLAPTQSLVKFQKTKDKDGFVAELSATTEVESELYQVKLRTKPGGALFEASITHNIKSNTFSTKISDVSRINMYGSQARCVENEFFHLRKYCYCKDDKT